MSSQQPPDDHQDPPQTTATDNPTVHQTELGEDEPDSEGITMKEKRAKKSRLHTVPLGGAPIEVKLARMRKAIDAGADVNGLDYSLPKGHRDGRPLHACLRVTHMAGNATFRVNDQVIQFLLDQGADPRLTAGNALLFWSPLYMAESALERAGADTEWEKFYGRIVAMMKEAVVKLEAKEKAEKAEAAAVKSEETEKVEA